MRSLWLYGFLMTVFSGLAYCGSGVAGQVFMWGDALPSPSTLVIFVVGLGIVSLTHGRRKVKVLR